MKSRTQFHRTYTIEEYAICMHRQSFTEQLKLILSIWKSYYKYFGFARADTRLRFFALSASLAFLNIIFFLLQSIIIISIILLAVAFPSSALPGWSPPGYRRRWGMKRVLARTQLIRGWGMWMNLFRGAYKYN